MQLYSHAQLQEVFYGQIKNDKPKQLVRCIFHDDRRPSLSLDLDRNVYYCFGCGAKGRLTSLFREPLDTCRSALLGGRKTILPTCPDTAILDKASKLNEALWNQARPVMTDDAAYKYLKGRNIDLPNWPSVIRCHQNLKYFEQGQHVATCPAMLALVQDENSLPISIHRTYLTPNGHKADVLTQKKLTTSASFRGIKGCAIRLFPHVDELAIAEGIESAISFFLLTGIPTWAAVSSSGLTNFIPPSGLKTLVIAADNDEAGLKAAETLASRLKPSELNLNITIKAPTEPGRDFNDILKGGFI